METDKPIQAHTTRTENLPLQTALSVSSRTSLGTVLADLANVTTARTLLGMTVGGLSSWLQRERKTIPSAASAAQISAHLAKLIPHYWTPDLTDAQMRSKFQDFCCDLAGVTEAGLSAACLAYRRNASNNFFPTPGKLLVLCVDDIDERKRRVALVDRAEEILASPVEAVVDDAGPRRSAAEILAAHGLDAAPQRRPVDEVVSELRTSRPEPISDALRQSLERLKATPIAQDARAMQEKLAERVVTG